MADTVDFSKMLQDAYQDAENDSQGNNPLPERKNPVIKNKDFIPDKGNPLYFRVVPLPDRWFAYGYRQLFVTLTKKDGTNFTTRLTFPRESKSNPIAKSEADQKLESLVNTIIAKNTEARVLNPNLKTDIIKLSNTPYFANIREVWEMPVMIYDMVQENGIVVAKPRVNPSTGAQMVMTLSMSGHTYNDLIKVVKDPINPPQGSTWNPMPIISTGLTYPFSIKRDQFYTVSIKSDVTVPEINPNYFQKDSNGEYMYFDDLAKFNAPSADSSPDFVERMVIPQLEAKLAQATGGTTTMAPQQGTNPYYSQQQPAQQAAYGPIPPVPQQPQGLSAEDQNSLDQMFGSAPAPTAPAQPQQAPAPQPQPAPQPSAQPAPAPQPVPQPVQQQTTTTTTTAPVPPVAPQPAPTTTTPDPTPDTNPSINSDPNDIVNNILGNINTQA